MVQIFNKWATRRAPPPCPRDPVRLRSCLAARPPAEPWNRLLRSAVFVRQTRHASWRIQALGSFASGESIRQAPAIKVRSRPASLRRACGQRAADRIIPTVANARISRSASRSAGASTRKASTQRWACSRSRRRTIRRISSGSERSSSVNTRTSCQWRTVSRTWPLISAASSSAGSVQRCRL